MNIKKIVVVLLVAVLLFSTAQQIVFGAEEETYTLPKIVVGEKIFPAKEGYKLIDHMWISEVFPQGDDVEWVDDPKIWIKAKELDPAGYADKANPNVSYLNAYVSKNIGSEFSFDDFASKGMGRVFIPKYYEILTVPSPGDIAWEGNRPWSQGFIVHDFDPNEGKVVVYGYENSGRYASYKTDVNRFYYFRVNGPFGFTSDVLTFDNVNLMVRPSRRSLMVGHNGYFYPDRLVTRAEFAQILVNLFELDPPKVTETSFPDVKKTDWFAPAVEAAKKAGLINGTPEGKFLPRQHVTYEQVAVVLANYWKQTGLYQKRYNPAIYQPDVVGGETLHASLQTSFAREQVEFAVRLGVMPSRKDGRYHSFADAITRDEMADAIYIVSARRYGVFKFKNLPVFKDYESLHIRRLAVPIPD